jgi:hypothetical protein
MFAAKNILGEGGTHRKLTAFANNLTVFLGLLVLGFPVTPATIRTALASSILLAGATFQFVLRHTRLQMGVASVRIQPDASLASTQRRPALGDNREYD